MRTRQRGWCEIHCELKFFPPKQALEALEVSLSARLKAQGERVRTPIAIFPR